jgi:2-polyprenyl-3-methyl-5-hydroxy-6-metoxy-1,4-benzoquinol methylase
MEMRGMSTDSLRDNRSAIAAWNAAADHLDGFGDEGDWSHRHLLNPTLFALFGEVAGQRILDLGCGEGYLSRMLARRGALVTGVEPAERLYALCLEREAREPLGITYHQQDASALTLPAAAFDTVVMNMILQDIPDYQGAIRNAGAVVIPGGDVVISILHPCFEESASRWPDRNVVEIREYLAEFAQPQEVFALRYHRPLSTYINALLDEGLMLQRMVEPRLAPEIAARGNDRDAHVPSFLVLHLQKLA